MSFAWSAKVLLPPSLSKEGKTYFGPPGGMELLIEGAGAPPENASEIEVSLDIETVGSRITRVTAARLAGGSEAQ
jgi:hypothetical protein